MLRCKSLIFLGLLLASLAMLVAGKASRAAQDRTQGEKETEDPWQAVRFLVGEWEGAGKSKAGNSTIQRAYSFILQDEYLHGINKSVIPPSNELPKGEVHEDWEIYSFDRARGKLVMRQFNTEGFVNRYVLESISGDGRTLVFTTEAVENGPRGLRARTTFKVISKDEYTESFELAFSGGDFTPCVESRFKRKR